MANQQNQAKSASAGGSGSADQAQAVSETNISAEVLQKVVDQAAHFNLLSTPFGRHEEIAVTAPGNRGNITGFNINETLNRFVVSVQPATREKPLRAGNYVGEAVGRFTHRWMLMPDDFVAAPGHEPPLTSLNSTRSQRFVMLDSICKFGDGKDGFRGFGTGHTIPATVNGKSELLVATIGSIVEGFGKFSGCEEGTYVYCGSLSVERGFVGNILMRVMDPRGKLLTSGSLSDIKQRSFPEPGITYIVLRGEAVPSDPVTPRIGPDGQFQGLNVEQGLRLLSLDCQAGGRSGLKSTSRVGQIVGRILARVNFNPAYPGGTTLNPIPFTTFDEFTIFDRNGKTIGGFTGNSTEGRVFNTIVGGQKGIRFGGIGHLLEGTGSFSGIDGLLTDNSVVIFSPHVSASVYILRINDRDGKFVSKNF